MDSDLPNGEPASPSLETATVTPIAELGPHLTDTAARATKGVVTIVWPYSIVTKSLSFVLAEPDFRLRREKGQVRVTFSGSCAKAVAEASIGGGDEVLLSLDGVEWVENDAPGPGKPLEWQAKFPSGALLKVLNSYHSRPLCLMLLTCHRLPENSSRSRKSSALTRQMRAHSTPNRYPLRPPNRRSNLPWPGP